MKDKVLASIKEHSMVCPGDTVIAALSGGADSMCLLSVLLELQKELGITVAAAHMNHQLRGAEADRDEAFVADWCRTHGVPLHIERKNIAELALQYGLGTEECGRKERYAFFARVTQQYASAKIATAHTLSDQQETVLLHLTRGTGSRGLCGIPPVRGNIIRPLLECTREEIEEYCRQNTIPYVVDATNRDVSYARNRIRHNVIPELEKINPGFSESIRRMTRQMAEQEEYLTACANAALERAKNDLGYSTAILSAEPSVIRLRCCRIAAEKEGVGDLAECHLKAIDRLLFFGGHCALPGKYSAGVFRGSLRFLSDEAKQPASEVSIPVMPPQEIEFFNKKFSFSIIDAKFFFEKRKVYKNLVSAAVNYDTISGSSSIVLRNRRAGDIFSPSGRGVSKKVKKLFNEQGILPEERERTAILEAGGTICWIEGIGVSEQAKILPDTRKILIIAEEVL